MLKQLGGKQSNQKCAIDQDSRLIQAVMNPDDPEDSVGPFNHVYYNAGNFAAPNHNDAHNVDHNDNNDENENEHGNEDEENDEQNEEENDSDGDVQIPKKLEILVYSEEGDIIDAIHTDIIVADLEDWNSLAQRIFEVWRQRNDGEAPEMSEAINPANCWPGYTTEYIEWSAEDASGLELFQWGVDSWEDVKDRLNCLEIRPQHKDHDSDQGEEEEEKENSTKRQRGMIDFRR